MDKFTFTINNGSLITFRETHEVESDEVFKYRLGIVIQKRNVSYDVSVIVHLDESNLPQNILDIIFDGYDKYDGVAPFTLTPKDLYDNAIYCPIEVKNFKTKEEVDTFVEKFNPSTYTENMEDRLLFWKVDGHTNNGFNLITAKLS